MGKKKKLTLEEVVRKAGRAGGRARAEKLSPEERKSISEMGASAGGKARAKALTRQQRSEIARRAAEARWKKKR
jgi:hypothetical protein